MKPLLKQLDERIVPLLARYCLHRIDDEQQKCVECGLTVREIITNQKKAPQLTDG